MITLQDALASHIAAIEAAAAEASTHKDDHKAALASVLTAARQAGWAAFDYVSALPSDEQSDAGDEAGKLIATARGVKGVNVYRERGRAFATYNSVIAKKGETHTLTKGERKGEQVNGRDEADPFSIAAGLLRQAAANKKARDAIMADADTLAMAKADVADAEGMTANEVAALYDARDADVMQAVHNQMDAIKARNVAKANIGAAMQAIRDVMQSGDFGALDYAAASIGAESFGTFLADCLQSRREAMNTEEESEFEPVGETGAVRLRDAA